MGGVVGVRSSGTGKRLSAVDNWDLPAGRDDRGLQGWMRLETVIDELSLHWSGWMEAHSLTNHGKHLTLVLHWEDTIIYSRNA